MKALIILNPHAGSGRALRDFEGIKSSLPKLFDAIRVAVTLDKQELGPHLVRAIEEGYDTVLVLGGDGTNLAVVNALAQFAQTPPATRDQSALLTPLTFASLPFGTGRDWARTLGIPQKPADMLRWLANATPQPVDLGRVTIDGETQWFMNVASVGITGQIAQRVNAKPVKRPWIFLQATVGTLLRFNAPQMRVFLDGKFWYEGDILALAVANGRFFGRGMPVCPNAYINDGWFEVVLVEGMSKLKALTALPTLLIGTHLERDDVHLRRARQVRVEGINSPLSIEMDGEPSQGQVIEFEVSPNALRMLVDMKQEALKAGFS
ncbi:MAG: diacylglycerol/lipid kinase family protein [Ardenticatenaceae bacterium]